jgi:hypothetical protein
MIALPACAMLLTALRARDRWFSGQPSRTLPWHAMTRFPGGQRGCTGHHFKNATAWKL